MTPALSGYQSKKEAANAASFRAISASGSKTEAWRVYPQEQTSPGHNGMSEKCQEGHPAAHHGMFESAKPWSNPIASLEPLT